MELVHHAHRLGKLGTEDLAEVIRATRSDPTVGEPGWRELLQFLRIWQDGPNPPRFVVEFLLRYLRDRPVRHAADTCVSAPVLITALLEEGIAPRITARAFGSENKRLALR